jgi:hypothetical protein
MPIRKGVSGTYPTEPEAPFFPPWRAVTRFIRQFTQNDGYALFLSLSCGIGKASAPRLRHLSTKTSDTGERIHGPSPVLRRAAAPAVTVY